ncbi:MAG TPA: PQQ-binding-like beta-propeller repeat protein [Verrucomicrobiales bacterium]|nr:PQQ-binding-like beta-propeller repeat protein [Verrucomicrobiales bacterium]
MKFALFAAVLAFLSGTVRAGNWPAWRGPAGDGVTTETDLPLKWSVTENVAWKTPLPDGGNSTPVVWGDSIFVTQATEKGKKRSVICFDRKDGHERWRHTVVYEKPELTHETNPYCGSSPVTDGERVIASHASAGVVCVDFAGKEIWRRHLGEQRHIWGSGASPVIAGDRVFLNFGPGPNATLVCMNKRNGDILWRQAEPGGSSGEPPAGGGKAEWAGSWGDPLLRRVGDREELILTWPGRLCALDPASGREWWTCSGLNPLIYTSPVFSDGIAVAMGGYNGSALAVKAGGSGDVTSTRLWLAEKTRQRIGSPVVHEGHLYILTDPGFAECRSLQTGGILWEERLKGPGPTGQNWSSLVRSGDRLYAVNQGGDAFVFKAAPKFELFATNPMGEKVIASIAVSDGQLFIRSYQHLWCIGSRKGPQ